MSVMAFAREGHSFPATVLRTKMRNRNEGKNE